MGFRSASILTLIISGIIIGCTDAVSTNYHDEQYPLFLPDPYAPDAGRTVGGTI